jgi:hypothetical protein
METAGATAVDRRRKQPIAVGCAALQEHRGWRQWSSHGLVRVRTAVALAVWAHNLLVWPRGFRQKHHARQIEALPEEKAA